MSNPNLPSTNALNLFIQFTGKSIKTVGMQMTFTGHMKFLFGYEFRNYTLSKDIDMWYLTTSTKNKDLYELSKNKDIKLYMIMNYTKVNDGLKTYPLRSILKKEYFSLLLELNPYYPSYISAVQTVYYQLLTLNLTFDPSIIGSDSDEIY